MPDFDPSLLDLRPRDTEMASHKDDPLIWNSQVLAEPSIEVGRAVPTRGHQGDYDDDDINIDLDLDLEGDEGLSIEFGRNAASAVPLNDDLMTNNLFSKDHELENAERTRLSSEVPSLIEDRDEPMADNDNIMLDGDDELILPASNDGNSAIKPKATQLERDSQSPLSSLPSDDLYQQDLARTDLGGDEDPSIQQATHKAKKRKVLPNDSVTMLTSDIIKKQQADRSAILKPASFLPRDPVLLNLMNLQKKGAFVSSILGNGPIKGLAPELRGVLSIEVIRKSNHLKRKRDGDSIQRNNPEAEAEAEADVDPSRVRFDLSANRSNLNLDDDVDIGTVPAGDNTIIDIPADDNLRLPQDEAPLEGEDPGGADAFPDQFDETTAPLLHPMEQGAISQGTKHAVHLLRDRFGSSADGNPSQQKKANIFFQELLPERTTTKLDATKMFFETLVLATKDAIKVEQGDKEVGSNIRIRAKRGLWGAWAEEKAGGEIAELENGSAPATATS